MTTVINDATGKLDSLHTDADGNLRVTGGGDGGGGGDASAANQTTEIARLTAIAASVAAGATSAKQDALLAVQATPVDSIGGALPLDFDFLAETYGYTGSDLTTIVKTKGANTWTQTLTYSTGTLTAASKWVKV